MSTETDEIKNRLNIVDLVGEYVRLQKAGANFKGLCPFHNEKSPSFTVHEEKQIFHCFGCSKGGDVFEFLMEMEGMDFRESLKTLAEKAGVELSNNYKREGGSEKKDRSLEILELATKFYQKQLLDGHGKARALPYLEDRGISMEHMQLFRLGFVPEGWNTIEQFLSARGYATDEIQKTGLLVQKEADPNASVRGTRRYDRFRNRILFPITDVLGRVIGYSARALPGDDDAQAKYINTPETTLYHKSKVLYGIAQAKQSIKQKNEVLIVEGNMDVIAMHQAGFENVVAVSGTALTQDHIGIIKRYTRNVVLFFDMDEAGQEAARKSALLGFQNELDLSVISLSGGKDAAELAKDDPAALVQAVENKKMAMEYFLDVMDRKYDMHQPQQKKQMVNEALEIIGAFQNNVERDEWIKRLADRVGSSIDSIISVYQQRTLPQKTWDQKSVPREAPLEASLKGRAEALSDQIAGAMFSSGVLWEKGRTLMSGFSPEERRYISAHVLLEKALVLGEECHFDFDEFRNTVGDNDLCSRAQRLILDHAFQEVDGGEMIEISVMDLSDEMEHNIHELKKEVTKEQLNQLIQAIRKAEESGDRATKDDLSRKFTQLSQDLNK